MPLVCAYAVSVLFALLAVVITARRRQDFPTTWGRRSTVGAMVLLPGLNAVYGAVILVFCQSGQCPIRPRAGSSSPDSAG